MAPDDDAGFLARWSRRKRQGGAAVPQDGPPLPVAARVPAVAPPRAAAPGPAEAPAGAASRPALPSGPASDAPAGAPAACAPAGAAAACAPAGTSADPASAGAAPPTLDDVAALDAGADVTRFVARDVDPMVRNAALKKLFADPRWNVMDGLDVYIDDYGKPDPLPPAMLRQLVQSHALGLFADEEKPAPAHGAATAQNAAAPRVDDRTAAASPAATPSEPDADEDAAVRLQPDAAAGPAGDRGRAGEDAGRER